MVATNFLISPILSLDALAIAGADKTFRVYFHDQEGEVTVSLGHSPQIITALSPSDAWLLFATNQLAKISNSADVSFQRVYDSANADISFYHDTSIQLGDPNATVFGLAVTNKQGSRQWTEIFLNGPELQAESEDFNNYVFNHELAHALGLEHAFDDSDGDVYLSTDPQLSATPEETVMSYRSPESGVYPNDLSVNDYNALLQIWGSPQTQSTENIVYRLYQQSTGRHLFSANSTEIDILTGVSASDYINEGIAYQVQEGADQDLYRFFQPYTGLHFYSANSEERDHLINLSQSGYIYEGVAYKVFSASSAPQGSSSVSRFYDPVASTHFYTANLEEQRILEVTHPSWIMEGTAWYV